MLKKASWIFYVSSRFSKMGTKSRSSVTFFLAALCIAIGVMALIVTLSVMNGFQIGYIDSILELDSFHIRVEGANDEDEELLRKIPGIKAVVPFFETQALAVCDGNSPRGIFLHAVPHNICETDKGFSSEMVMYSGTFDLRDENSILLGADLAYLLDAEVGDEISLVAMSGTAETELFSADRVFSVTGLFMSDYNKINASMAFVSIDNDQRLFGKNAVPVLGLKLEERNRDLKMLKFLGEEFPSLEFSSWRDYNRAFFSVLQVEKNTIFLMVLLIFLVVAVNIYHSLCRIIYERREEIALLSALGGQQWEVGCIFLLHGFKIGFFGAFFGVISGIVVCLNIQKVFYALAFLSDLFLQQSYFQLSSFLLFAEIPAKIIPGEVAFIAIFALISATVAAFGAQKQIQKAEISEVLHAQ